MARTIVTSAHLSVKVFISLIFERCFCCEVKRAFNTYSMCFSFSTEMIKVWWIPVVNCAIFYIFTVFFSFDDIAEITWFANGGKLDISTPLEIFDILYMLIYWFIQLLDMVYRKNRKINYLLCFCFSFCCPFPEINYI